MIRIRGLPISEGNAAELARGLRAQGASSLDVAERLERALALGSGMIGASTVEARAVLAVLDEGRDDRLLEIRDELREYVGSQ